MSKGTKYRQKQPLVRNAGALADQGLRIADSRDRLAPYHPDCVGINLKRTHNVMCVHDVVRGDKAISYSGKSVHALGIARELGPGLTK